MSFNLALVKK